MSVTDLLDRPIAYHRIFVALTGSVKAAILLSQALYWQKRAKQKDGWWYKTAEEWQDETGLTRHEQETARKACERYLETDLRDAPARLYWKVNEKNLSDDLLQFGGKRETGLAENAKLDSRKTPTINKKAETTTDIEKKYPTFSQKVTDERREMMKLAERMEAEIGITPDFSDRKWEKVVRQIVRHEENGQRFETFAKWLKSGNEYNRPKTFQIAAKPQLILTNWVQAFQEMAKKVGERYGGIDDIERILG